MANDIYNYGQRRTSINNPFTGENEWFNNVTEAPMGLGNLQQSRRLMDPTMMMNQLGNRPSGVFPESENLIPPFMEEPSGVGEGYDRRRIRDVIGNQISRFTTPVMSVLKGLGDKFQRSPEKVAAYESIMGDRKGLGIGDTQTGTYGGTGYDLQQTPSGLKVYSDVNPFGKNFDSGFGSQSLKEMDDKTLAWAQERLRTGKGLSQRLRNILQNRGMLDVTGVDRVGDNIPIGPISAATTGRTTGRDQPRAYTLDRLQSPAGNYAAARERTSSRVGPGGNVRAYGLAQGGRIGYQGGELVEDESMMEATPTGMMEENIEEVQGEPSREQLEAIAFEIFQLPLEELNEEQLEVVYQAAMEQEPSEEEVQFAAQEGPGEGIASLV